MHEMEIITEAFSINPTFMTEFKQLYNKNPKTVNLPLQIEKPVVSLSRKQTVVKFSLTRNWGKCENAVTRT